MTTFSHLLQGADYSNVVGQREAQRAASDLTPEQIRVHLAQLKVVDCAEWARTRREREGNPS